MSAIIRRWILLGPANGLKTEIVMRCLLLNPIIKKRPFVFVCESEQGCAVDYARNNGIEVLHVEDRLFKTEASRRMLDSIDAELLVVCGWNYIVPRNVFERFPFPCLNCHSSLLPDYKGQCAYLHQWANCEEEYGVTIHILEEKLDEGCMLLQNRMKLYLRENLVMMHRRVSEATGLLLPQALLLLEQGYRGAPYDQSAISRYFHKITPYKAKAYRVLNRFARLLNLPPFLTPHNSSQHDSIL